VEFSLNLSAIYTKWCAQTFPTIFGLCSNFDRNFAKIMAPASDGNENYVVRLKEQPILKKCWKPHQNRPINRHTILVRTMSPTRSQTKRDIQKTPIFAPTAGAPGSISSKLCMLIENVMTISAIFSDLEWPMTPQHDIFRHWISQKRH